MIILPDAEDRTIVSSFIWTKHQNVTDGQRDRQTESLWLLQRSALRAMRTRCKKTIHWYRVMRNRCWRIDSVRPENIMPRPRSDVRLGHGLDLEDCRLGIWSYIYMASALALRPWPWLLAAKEYIWSLEAIVSSTLLYACHFSSSGTCIFNQRDYHADTSGTHVQFIAGNSYVSEMQLWFVTVSSNELYQCALCDTKTIRCCTWHQRFRLSLMTILREHWLILSEGRRLKITSE